MIVIVPGTILEAENAFLLYNIGKKGGRQNVTFHHSDRPFGCGCPFGRKGFSQQKKGRRTGLRWVLQGK